MRTAYEISPPCRPAVALGRLLRPAVGFHHPMDVVRDPILGPDEKRAILSSWASDGCAVEDRPTLRWMLGTDAPVPLSEVLGALDLLDRRRPS